MLRTVGTCQKTVSLSLVDDLEGDDEVPPSHDTTFTFAFDRWCTDMVQVKPRFVVTGLVLWGKRHLLAINLKRAVLGKPNDGVINGARTKEKLHSLGVIITGFRKNHKQRLEYRLRTNRTVL